MNRMTRNKSKCGRYLHVYEANGSSYHLDTFMNKGRKDTPTSTAREMINFSYKSVPVDPEHVRSLYDLAEDLEEN